MVRIKLKKSVQCVLCFIVLITTVLDRKSVV